MAPNTLKNMSILTILLILIALAIAKFIVYRLIVFKKARRETLKKHFERVQSADKTGNQ